MKKKITSRIMKKIQLTINGSSYVVEVDENMPLLWVLRDEIGLVGTKYGCGAGLCGACSVLIDGVSMRSCQIPAGYVNGKITTIEGLGNPIKLHVIQESWIEHQVAQCGYCQSGQIISAYSLLANNPRPNEKEIESAMVGNLCRCGTYSRIRKAIRDASEKLSKTSQTENS